jgi:hypothetical protein
MEHNLSPEVAVHPTVLLLLPTAHAQIEDIRRGAQPDTGRVNPWCHVQCFCWHTLRILITVLCCCTASLYVTHAG